MTSRFSIVLDIDETLVHTFETTRINFGAPEIIPFSHEFFELHMSTGHTFQGARRPDMSVFLNFCSKYFLKVFVWSAGMEDYVESVVSELFPLGMPIQALWSRKDCVKDKTTMIKPLKKLAEAERLDLATIFVLDDFEQTYKNNPDNAIPIPEFAPLPEAIIKASNTRDASLSKVMTFLTKESTLSCSDVRKLKKP